MPTPAAALKLMRSVCLSLPYTSEGTHYGKASFKVRRTMFATYGEEKTGWGMVVALEPEHFKLVLATDKRFSAFRGYRNCVFLAASDMKDREEVRELATESYNLVAGAATSKRRATKNKVAAKKKPTKDPKKKTPANGNAKRKKKL